MNNKILKAIQVAIRYLTPLNGMEDIANALGKLKEAEESLTDNEVTIALLGDFSDGKTTCISGMLDKIMDNMKIGINESSDEIGVYETDFLDKTFRIVDTPGLFGSKEKIDQEGKKQRLSDITEKYISQANIVVYVTESTTPLPLRHQDKFRHIMLDLRKLWNTILVINRMDENYDVDDEEDFKEGVEIKTKNLRQTVQDCLSLSPEEAGNIPIICIAAKPQNADFPTIEDWLKERDLYRSLSRIDHLKDAVMNMANQIDRDSLKYKTALDMASESIQTAEKSIELILFPLKGEERKLEDNHIDLTRCVAQEDLSMTDRWNILRTNLDNLREDIIQDISTSTMDTLEDVLLSSIGYKEGKVDFSIVTQKIDNEFASCNTSINGSLQNTCRAAVNLGLQQDKILEGLMNDAIKKGIKHLKDVNIKPEFVGQMRDLFFKDFKFKPYGKIKMAGYFGKGLKGVAAGLGIGLDLYEGWQKRKEEKKFKETKRILIETLNELFNENAKFYMPQNSFLENFAPELLELHDLVKEKDGEIKELKTRIAQLEKSRNELRMWAKEYIEDVNYTMSYDK